MAAGAQRGRRTGDGGAAAVRAAPARTRCNPFFMRDAGGERPLVCELQPEPRHAPSGASAARGLQRSPCVGLCRRAAASSTPPSPSLWWRPRLRFPSVKCGSGCGGGFPPPVTDRRDRRGSERLRPCAMGPSA